MFAVLLWLMTGSLRADRLASCGLGFTPTTTQTLAALTRLLAEHGAEIVELHVRKASLEEIFLKLTRPEAPPVAP
jgi:hypothetical protein